MSAKSLEDQLADDAYVPSECVPTFAEILRAAAITDIDPSVVRFHDSSGASVVMDIIGNPMIFQCFNNKVQRANAVKVCEMLRTTEPVEVLGHSVDLKRHFVCCPKLLGEVGIVMDKVVPLKPLLPFTGTRTEKFMMIWNLALGLTAFHLAGFAHNDPTIDNVGVTTGGRYVFYDFGMCGPATASSIERDWHQFMRSLSDNDVLAFSLPLSTPRFLETLLAMIVDELSVEPDAVWATSR